jgi:4-hydroxy-2-oxoheptanedioate aldolase
MFAVTPALCDGCAVFLKQRLRTCDVLRGVVNVIPSAVATQAIAAAGADFVMIDREHGPIGAEALHAMVASTAGTACAALVRVPTIDEGDVKAALDAGAEGIVFPLVRTAADAERCVSLATYPPDGMRGWGPFVAHSRFGTTIADYAKDVGPQVTCCLLIETPEAVENIDAILEIPGIDLAVVAQFDLSIALDVFGQFDSPVFLKAVSSIERAAAAKGMPLGAAALSPEQSRSLIAKRYRVLVHGFDVLMLKNQIAGFQTWT